MQERCVPHQIGSSVDYRKMTSVQLPVLFTLPLQYSFQFMYHLIMQVICFLFLCAYYWLTWILGGARFLLRWQSFVCPSQAKVPTINWGTDTFSTRGGSCHGEKIEGTTYPDPKISGCRSAAHPIGVNLEWLLWFSILKFSCFIRSHWVPTVVLFSLLRNSATGLLEPQTILGCSVSLLCSIIHRSKTLRVSTCTGLWLPSFLPFIFCALKHESASSLYFLEFLSCN